MLLIHSDELQMFFRGKHGCVPLDFVELLTVKIDSRVKKKHEIWQEIEPQLRLLIAVSFH